MKAAICISGLPHHFEKGFNLLKRNLLDLLPEYDIYISTWDDDKVSWDKLKSTYSPKSISIEKYVPSQLLDYSKIIKALNEFKVEDPEANPTNQIPMYYQIWKCNELVKSSNVKYDLIIRTRFDLVPSTPLDLRQLDNAINNPNLLYTYIDPRPSYPNWTYDGFAIGSPEVMNIYSNMFLNLYDQIIKSNSWVTHILLRDYLQDKPKIEVKNLNNVIGIYRGNNKFIAYFSSMFDKETWELSWKNLSNSYL